MNIKIVINNRNRLTTTKNMVEKLLELNPSEQIIIIDNGSTYSPLLNWYEFVGKKIDIRYCDNEGHLALWSTGIYKELGEYFVYTDSDIELNNHFPVGWKEKMLHYANKYDTKVGLAIRIDDLPECYRYRNQVARNEGRWWLKKLEDEVYEADTDTTFFLMKNTGDNQYSSVRLANIDLICRHAPWYINLDKLSQEEVYYLKNVGERVTTQYTKQHINPEKYNDV